MNPPSPIEKHAAALVNSFGILNVNASAPSATWPLQMWFKHELCLDIESVVQPVQHDKHPCTGSGDGCCSSGTARAIRPEHLSLGAPDGQKSAAVANLWGQVRLRVDTVHYPS